MGEIFRARDIEDLASAAAAAAREPGLNWIKMP